MKLNTVILTVLLHEKGLYVKDSAISQANIPKSANILNESQLYSFFKSGRTIATKHVWRQEQVNDVFVEWIQNPMAVEKVGVFLGLFIL